MRSLNGSMDQFWFIAVFSLPIRPPQFLCLLISCQLFARCSLMQSSGNLIPFVAPLPRVMREAEV